MKKIVLNIKRNLKLNSDLYFINLLSIVSGIIFYFITKNSEISIAILATGISISFGFRQYKIENDNMFKDLFKDFNSRYDDNLNEIFNSFRFDNKMETFKEEEAKKVINYFNLCAEEFFWFKKKRIPTEIWDAWLVGIKSNLEIKEVNDLFISEINKFRKSYYGLGEYLGY